MRVKTATQAAAVCIIVTAFNAQTRELVVDPLVRYQEYLGVGGTAYGGNINANWYVNDLGAQVIRVHLEQDDHLNAAKSARSAADAAGRPLTVIASIWTPPGHMKIGPFYDGGCADGFQECGGTLDPAKYREFADWVNGKLDRYRNAGIPIAGLSLQNEPWLPTWYISCEYDAKQYLSMFRNVAPVVKARHPGTKLMAAEMWLGPNNHLKTLLNDPEAAKYCDISAHHGGIIETDESAQSARHNGLIARMWKSKNAIAHLYDDMQYRPVWQTECNLLCGWTSTANCNWGAGYTTDGPAFPEGANMLAMFRYGYGQVWTTYGISSEFQDEKRRQVYRHFGRLIRRGAEMIDCQQDTVNDVATVAFHHRRNKELTIVAFKGSKSSSTVSFTVPGLSSTGKWYLSDNGRNYQEQGSIGSGQTVTLPGQSMATFYWTNFSPDISRAAHPLEGNAAVANGGSSPGKHIVAQRQDSWNRQQVHDLRGRELNEAAVPAARGAVVAVKNRGAQTGTRGAVLRMVW